MGLVHSTRLIVVGTVRVLPYMSTIVLVVGAGVGVVAGAVVGVEDGGLDVFGVGDGEFVVGGELVAVGVGEEDDGLLLSKYGGRAIAPTSTTTTNTTTTLIIAIRFFVALNPICTPF